MNNSLIIVTGPTAVGKTDLSIHIAKKYGTEIISADSRQVYREMEIGTAKPDQDKLQSVRHHFINSHSITEEFSAGQFEREGLKVLNEVFKEKTVVVLTGGSGLYIKALIEGLDEMPDLDENIRRELNEQLKQNGINSLLEELKNSDPNYFDFVDRSNNRRIIRALEVIRGTGKPYSSFRNMEKPERSFSCIWIGLERDRAELYSRIEMRMDLMIKKGLVQEAQSLITYRDHPSLQTVGYSEIFDYLDKKYDYEEAVRLLKRNSRRYAKRQMTWFNKQEGIKWFHPDSITQIEGYLESRLSN